MLLVLQLLLTEFTFCCYKCSGLKIPTVASLREMLMTFQPHSSFVCECSTCVQVNVSEYEYINSHKL